MFTFMTQFTRKNIFKCCLLLNRMANYPYRMLITIFSCFSLLKEKRYSSLSIFGKKFHFLPQNAWVFFLKSKNGVLEIFLKSNILCTKILGTVKFFLKSKNFLKSNVLKSKIHCTTKFADSDVIFGWKPYSPWFLPHTDWFLVEMFHNYAFKECISVENLKLWLLILTKTLF